jgi:hypothetical protein
VPGKVELRLGRPEELWRHAVQSAAALGYRSLELESDPDAEGFYAAMGATWIGERESPYARNHEPGRRLPLMRVELETPESQIAGATASFVHGRSGSGTRGCSRDR